MVLITKDNLNECNLTLLNEFETNIYNKAFPEDEREYFSDIIRRIKCINHFEPQAFVALKLNDDSVVGGVVVDWYPQSRCFEIIYIVLNPLYRRKGEGTKMLWDAVDLFKSQIDNSSSINNIFIEVEEPHNRTIGDCEMNPIDRIRFWEKCGAKQIAFNYVQPPLSEDKNALFGLMLMALPLSKNENVILDKKVLKNFLVDFYVGLNAEKSPFLSKMCQEIDDLRFANRKLLI